MRAGGAGSSERALLRTGKSETGQSGEDGMEDVMLPGALVGQLRNGAAQESHAYEGPRLQARGHSPQRGRQPGAQQVK